MEKQSFKITIDAPREKVWHILWDDTTYRDWTSVFSPGSTVETDWKEGSRILFLDDKKDGMVSRIARKVDNEFMSFQHLGEVHNGVEDTGSEKVKKWAGASENYTLTDINGKTELTVEMDIADDFKDYFAKTWPKALDRLKSITERSNEQAVV